MKKLTAGIFTVLMGLVSVNAADAAVASSAYVNAKISQAQDVVQGNIDTLSQTVETNKEAADATQQALELFTGTTYANDKSALEQGIQDAKNALTTFQTGTYATDKQALQDAIDTKVAKSDYENKVQELQNDISTLSGDGAGSVSSLITASEQKITAAYELADSGLQQSINTLTNTVNTNKSAADETQTQLNNYISSNDTALQNEVTARTTADSTMQDEIDAVELLVGTTAVSAQISGAISASEAATKTAYEKYVSDAVSEVETGVGDMDDLSTDSKTSIVAAINEVDAHADTNTQHIGTMTSLQTSAKSDLVSAINEVKVTADNAIPKPQEECSNKKNYCVLTFGQTATGTGYYWEVIERVAGETLPDGTVLQ